MKILVIHGSMREGNTHKVTLEALRWLRKKPEVEIEEIKVSELELDYCLACNTCFSIGENKCPHIDTMAFVRASMDRADGIIFTSPVYSMGVSAPMKNLIDHLSYHVHRPRYFEKKGMVIVTAANEGEKKTAKYLQSTLGHWGMNKAVVYAQKVSYQDNFTLSIDEIDRIDSAAQKLYEDIALKRIKSPSLETVVTHNIFRGMALAEQPISEYTAGYWKNSILRTSIYPIKAGLLSHIMGSIMYRIFLKRFS